MKPIGLVPELNCTDIKASLDFYLNVLGFSILYQRSEEQFAYLKRGNAEIMLEQPGLSRTWLTGALERPFGRGVNFQIETDDVNGLYEKVLAHKAKVFLPIEEKWYRRDEQEVGNRQFIVQDPDGYLLRFFQDLGVRQSS